MREDETPGSHGCVPGCLGGIWSPRAIMEGIARVRREGKRSSESLL